MSAQGRNDEIQIALLRYLASHPYAMDTVEGVAGWWLPREQDRTGIDAITRVLRQLVDWGLLEEVEGGDSPRYRLRRVDSDW